MISFSVAAMSGIAGVLLVLWGINGFQGFGIGTAGTVAIVLGIVFTSALGVGLMALVFYSDRSNADEQVYHPVVSGVDSSKDSISPDTPKPDSRPP